MTRVFLLGNRPKRRPNDPRATRMINISTIKHHTVEANVIAFAFIVIVFYQSPSLPFAPVPVFAVVFVSVVFVALVFVLVFCMFLLSLSCISRTPRVKNAGYQALAHSLIMSAYKNEHWLFDEQLQQVNIGNERQLASQELSQYPVYVYSLISWQSYCYKLRGIDTQ